MMKIKLCRRQFLHLAVGAAALPAVSRVARAQAYPTRPVRLILGTAAGSSADIAARLIGQWLSQRTGQQFIIENRPGAASNIATETVVKAPADGYTLLFSGFSNAINVTLYEKLNFDFIRDTTSVGSVASVTNIMAVHPSVPVQTVAEFIAYAKANPGKINHGTGGIGAAGHVFGELFKMMTGLNLVHIPYGGGGPMLVDLLAGQVQVSFDGLPASLEYVTAGKLRALAVTTAARSEVVPDIPTLGEFVPGYEASQWYGVSAPKNTPSQVVDKLNNEINAGLRDPGLKARFAELGCTVLPGSPTDFGKLIADETAKWAKVVKFAGLKAD